MYSKLRFAGAAPIAAPLFGGSSFLVMTRPAFGGTRYLAQVAGIFNTGTGSNSAVSSKELL
jgi:hypothetical protein